MIPESPPIDRLRAIMAKLRDPDGGCPWDLEQSFETIAPYTLEEAYEVVDAIDRQAHDELCAELGDLLLQVVFHSQMAKEADLFDFDDVATSIGDKMIRRHPHVFGDDGPRSTHEQTAAWEEVKAQERAGSVDQDQSLLANVPKALPALTRALKLQRRMARVGFEWRTIDGIDAKLEEELDELREARDGGYPDRIEDELGDVLFTIVNLARRLDIDPETALSRSNRKFERRARSMEAQGPMEGLSLEALEARWVQAKASD